MAKKIIRNKTQLRQAYMEAIKKVVEEMRNRVYETLNYFLQEYYDSYDPVSYRRTKDFLYSAVKTDVQIDGNKAIAFVYIDTESMDNYYNATGYQVASWANEGLHGGKDLGNGTPHVWDDTMKETIVNGELLRLAKEYLRKEGFKVR